MIVTVWARRLTTSPNGYLYSGHRCGETSLFFDEAGAFLVFHFGSLIFYQIAYLSSHKRKLENLHFREIVLLSLPKLSNFQHFIHSFTLRLEHVLGMCAQKCPNQGRYEVRKGNRFQVKVHWHFTFAVAVQVIIGSVLNLNS